MMLTMYDVARNNFYPRPPRGGRLRVSKIEADFDVFLSTSSARRTTGGLFDNLVNMAFLSTSSARRTTPARPTAAVVAGLFLSTSSARRTTICYSLKDSDLTISIHVLREEDDRPPASAAAGSRTFLSTSSARRTTRKAELQAQDGQISIHVLREEDDPRRPL